MTTPNLLALPQATHLSTSVAYIAAGANPDVGNSGGMQVAANGSSDVVTSAYGNSDFFLRLAFGPGLSNVLH